GLWGEGVSGSVRETRATGLQPAARGRCSQKGSHGSGPLCYGELSRGMDICGGAGMAVTPTAPVGLSGRTVTTTVCCTPTLPASVAFTVMVAVPYCPLV